MPDDIDWLVVGDFNLYKNPEDRNKPDADVAEMLLFNNAISMLGLVELPLKGKRFTWSNKQFSPLLECLDWFFTSTCWTLNYPHSYVTTMSMETSDHTPCLISINTSIPRSHIFHFKIFWMQHDDFISQVQEGWPQSTQLHDAAKSITAKFKNLRKTLKDWSHTLSNLKETIERVKLVLDLLNFLEEFRDLSLVEWNFRVILEDNLVSLLKQQKSYWKQRGQIKWVTLGDASTHFFHAHATMKYRRNLITYLANDNGDLVYDHESKAELLWQSFKERLGTSNFTGIQLDLSQHFVGQRDLSHLVMNFTKTKIDQVVKNLPSYKAPGPDGFNTDFLKKY